MFFFLPVKSIINIEYTGFFPQTLEYLPNLQALQPYSQLPVRHIKPFGYCCQIAALQQAYDGMCVERGTTAVPYFLMKYTADTVHVAPLADWDAFFTDTNKVAKLFFFGL